MVFQALRDRNTRPVSGVPALVCVYTTVQALNKSDHSSTNALRNASADSFYERLSCRDTATLVASC